MNISETLTEKNVDAIAELRQRVSDVLPHFKNDYLRHDMSLIRFLLARNFDLDKSEEMLRKSIEWRQKAKVDSILTMELPRDIPIKFPLYFSGFCRQGYPVVMTRIGKWDVRKAVEAGQKNAIRDYVCKFFEFLLDMSRQITTDEIYYGKTNAVIDFEGLAFRTIASKEVINLALEVVQIFEANYPEILNRAWFVNAPSVFQIAWAIIKPFLSEFTISKIQIMGGNRDSWRTEWSKYLDPESFPAMFGGANTNCMHLVDDLQLDKFLTPLSIFEDEHHNKIFVEPKKDVSVRFEIPGACTFEWNFRTEDYNIGFSVQNAKGQNLVEQALVDSHLCPQLGSLEFDREDTCILTFHNGHSRMQGKSLKYAARVTTLIYDDSNFSW